MWSSFLPIEEDSATTDEILRIFLTRAIGDGLRTWELSRSLAEAKPDSGAAQYVFALLTSEIVGDLPQEQRPAAVASARRAATRAAALLPNPGRALAVLDCNLEPPGLLVLTPKCDRRVREEIAQDPNVPLLPYLFGWQLLEAGRFGEAGTMADMDLAQDPLGPGQLALRIFAGRSTSSNDEDLELPKLEARMERYLGAASMVQFDYKVAISNGEIDAAKALLENPAEGSEIASGRTKTVIELVLRALKSRSSSDIAAMHEGCSPPPPANPPDAPAFGTCLVGLTMLNDLDSAFALADRGYDDLDCCSPQQREDRWLASGGGFYPRYELFGKATAPMRADRRFIEVARRTGLLAYWKSGHPPDFCAAERVPVCGALRSGETTGR
jgi:hypothetical protein